MPTSPCVYQNGISTDRITRPQRQSAANESMTLRGRHPIALEREEEHVSWWIGKKATASSSIAPQFVEIERAHLFPIASSSPWPRPQSILNTLCLSGHFLFSFCPHYELAVGDVMSAWLLLFNIFFIRFVENQEVGENSQQKKIIWDVGNLDAAPQHPINKQEIGYHNRWFTRTRDQPASN